MHSGVNQYDAIQHNTPAADTSVWGLQRSRGVYLTLWLLFWLMVVVLHGTALYWKVSFILSTHCIHICPKCLPRHATISRPQSAKKSKHIPWTFDVEDKLKRVYNQIPRRKYTWRVCICSLAPTWNYKKKKKKNTLHSQEMSAQLQHLMWGCD